MTVWGWAGSSIQRVACGEPLEGRLGARIALQRRGRGGEGRGGGKRRERQVLIHHCWWGIYMYMYMEYDRNNITTT